MTPDDVLAIYERAGPDWVRQRSHVLFERRWLDRFRAHLPVTGRPQRVLDLGCGDGRPIAAYLSERGAEITGVDGAASMVTEFAARMPDSRIIHADMRSLSLETRFEGIIAWDSFFHLSAADQRDMFATFAAHAASGAALMFTSGHRAGTALGEVAGETIFHESLDPDEYRRLLDEAGFDVVSYVPEDETCGGHTVWLARAR